MQKIKKAFAHFTDFHRGVVNITLHTLGFLFLFYSLSENDWAIFILAIVMLEAGHVYNHVTGIKLYDFRLKRLAHRFISFAVLVAVVYVLINGWDPWLCRAKLSFVLFDHFLPAYH